jgi:hypothetical protein
LIRIKISITIMIVIAFFRAGFEGNQDPQIHDWPMPPSHRKYPDLAKFSGPVPRFKPPQSLLNALRFPSKKFIQPRM